MFIGFIVGIILVVLAVAAGVIASACFSDDKNGVGAVSTIVCIALAIAFFLVPFSFRTVDTGEIAVVKQFGKVVDVRDSGMHFDLWVTKSYSKYDTKVQNVEISTMAYSSDAQMMDIAMTLQYQIMSDKVIEIATQYGGLDILENRIQSIAIEKTKAVLSAYKAMDIIADRASISPAVEVAIKEAIGDEYYVNVNTVVLTNIDFSDAFELAVEEKMIAEQNKLKADYENQTKIAQAEAEAEARLKATQAEIEIAQAKAEAKLKEAQAQIDIAKAEAEALKIAAEAEAEANRIVADTLTEEIIKKILADRWDGKMPTVVGNGDYILPSDLLE